jgi:hypothetical protein
MSRYTCTFSITIRGSRFVVIGSSRSPKCQKKISWKCDPVYRFILVVSRFPWDLPTIYINLREQFISLIVRWAIKHGVYRRLKFFQTAPISSLGRSWLRLMFYNMTNVRIETFVTERIALESYDKHDTCFGIALGCDQQYAAYSRTCARNELSICTIHRFGYLLIYPRRVPSNNPYPIIDNVTISFTVIGNRRRRLKPITNPDVSNLRYEKY